MPGAQTAVAGIWAFVAFGMLRFQPVAALAGVRVGLRVVVTGRRHGAGALSIRGGSILFVVSPLSPHRYPLSSHRCLPIVVFPSLSPHRPSSSLSLVVGCWGRSSSSNRRVCHVPPLFPASYCLWRSWVWVIW